MSGIELGAFTRRAALQDGATDAQLRSPRLASPFHGVRTRVLPVTHLERARAYAPRLRSFQFFSHLAAAEIWEIPLPHRSLDDDPIHVGALAPHRPPRTRGVVGHTSASDAVEIVERRGVRVTSAATTWIMLGAVLSDRDLLVATDHLLLVPRFPRRGEERPFASRPELEERLDAHRGRGRRRLAQVLALASTRAASPRETGLRSLVREAGLPAPEVNAEIWHDGEMIAIGDLVFPRWKVLAEYDGDQHRTDDAQFARDRERALRLQLAGWITVVVRADGLGRGRARTVAEVRAALMAHGWRE